MEVELRLKDSLRDQLREMAEERGITQEACVASIFEILNESFRELMNVDFGFSFFYPNDLLNWPKSTFTFSEEQMRPLIEFTSIMNQGVAQDEDENKAVAIDAFLNGYLESPDETVGFVRQLLAHMR